MIVLHRLGHNAEPFHLNPDMILTVEALPDTVVTLTSGTKVVVVESPEHVADEVRAWRTSILRDALQRRRDVPPEPVPPLAPRPDRPSLEALDGGAVEELGPQVDHSG